jgi:hypothetical protein
VALWRVNTLQLEKSCHCWADSEALERTLGQCKKVVPDFHGHDMGSLPSTTLVMLCKVSWMSN